MTTIVGLLAGAALLSLISWWFGYHHAHYQNGYHQGSMKRKNGESRHSPYVIKKNTFSFWRGVNDGYDEE